MFQGLQGNWPFDESGKMRLKHLQDSERRRLPEDEKHDMILCFALLKKKTILDMHLDMREQCKKMQVYFIYT